MQSNQDDRARRIARLRHEALVFVAVIGVLAAINLTNEAKDLWFIYPMAGWGIPLLFRAWKLTRAPA